MPVRRMSPRRTEREQPVAYLHGIDPQGEIVHVLVDKNGKCIKSSGGVPAHTVSVNDSGDLERWIKEAESALGLEEVIGVHWEWVNISETLKKIQDLFEKAEEKSKNWQPQVLEDCPETMFRWNVRPASRRGALSNGLAGTVAV